MPISYYQLLLIFRHNLDRNFLMLFMLQDFSMKYFFEIKSWRLRILAYLALIIANLVLYKSIKQ